ncbi:MAG: hypothetical protein ACREXV_05455, partial [Polaromonas sp.]
GIDFVQADNAFLRIDNLPRAQALADALSPDMLHKRLDVYAQCGGLSQNVWRWRRPPASTLSRLRQENSQGERN